MTTYNIVYINNISKDDYGKLPEKKTVWVEHLIHGSFCIRVFSSKDAVIDSWTREYLKDEKLAKNRVVDGNHTIFLLNEHSEFFSKATCKEVEN